MDRFEDKFIPEPNSGCWLWEGSLTKRGYGHFRIDRKTLLAHRVSYRLYKGEIPKNLNVCHTCDVRCCVNPDHLYLGTQKDNMEDKVRRGRSYHPTQVGDKNNNTKLSVQDVYEIRYLCNTRRYTQKEIGDLYGVKPSTVSAIKLGVNWNI